MNEWPAASNHYWESSKETSIKSNLSFSYKVKKKTTTTTFHFSLLANLFPWLIISKQRFMSSVSFTNPGQLNNRKSVLKAVHSYENNVHWYENNAHWYENTSRKRHRNAKIDKDLIGSISLLKRGMGFFMPPHVKEWWCGWAYFPLFLPFFASQ